jgi:hypothetical protein
MSIDPRGPFRKVESVEVKPNGNFIKLSCGHTAHHAPHFMPPRIGDNERCFHCGEEQRKQQKQ